MRSRSLSILLNVMLVVGVVMCSGCASIVSKSQYPVNVSSSPTGAKLIVSNKQGIDILEGNTPTIVTLEMKDGYFSGQKYTFELEKEGYFPQTVVVDTKIDGWYIGNLCFGGVIGFLIVDPLTGAMWKVDEMLNVNLAPIPDYKPKKSEEEEIATQDIEISTPPPAESSIKDKLIELKELKDLEIITDDEYEERRNKLVEQLE